eukprot:3818463-Rhodomonas_salina.3
MPERNADTEGQFRLRISGSTYITISGVSSGKQQRYQAAGCKPLFVHHSFNRSNPALSAPSAAKGWMLCYEEEAPSTESGQQRPHSRASDLVERRGRGGECGGGRGGGMRIEVEGGRVEERWIGRKKNGVPVLSPKGLTQLNSTSRTNAFSQPGLGSDRGCRRDQEPVRTRVRVNRVGILGIPTSLLLPQPGRTISSSNAGPPLTSGEQWHAYPGTRGKFNVLAQVAMPGK